MDPIVILLFVVIALFIAMQFFSAKRRKAAADERAVSLLPGVEVMTTAGMYGTLISLDTEENIATLEIAPNVIVKMHSQAIRHAVTPADAAESDNESENDEMASGPQLNTSSAVPMAEAEEPQFGERAPKSTRKKPSSDTK